VEILCLVVIVARSAVLHIH